MANKVDASGAKVASDETLNTAEYLFRVSDASFKMETDRYDSLSSLSTRLLTSISILSVAIMSALALVSRPLVDNGLIVPLVTYSCIALAFLLLALILALVSQVRFKHTTLDNPASISAVVESYEKQYPTRLLAAEKYAQAYRDVHASIRRRNNIVMWLLSASLLSVIAAVLVVAVSAVLLVSAAAACGIIA